MKQEELLELYFNKLNTQPTLALVSRHEAAHAVMHYLVGLPSTRLEARADAGLCQRSGRAGDARQQILALLAGVAYEIKYCAWLIDLRTSKTADLEQARQLFAANAESRCVHLKGRVGTVGVEKALGLAMERACEILVPFHDEIERLGAALAAAGQLSARQTGALLRQRIGAERRLRESQWRTPLGLPMDAAGAER